MNKVFLIGRLTQDPQCQIIGDDKKCAKFSLAVNRTYSRDGDNKADFINIVAWDKLAQLARDYLTKGKQVAITGRIQTGSYERDGIRRTTFDVVAEQIEFIGSKQDGEPTPHRDASIDELKEVVDDDMPF